MIYFADDLGHCTELVNVRSGLKTMHYQHTPAQQIPAAMSDGSGKETKGKLLAQAAAAALGLGKEKDTLILVTVDVVLYKYGISPDDGKVVQERKVSDAFFAFPFPFLQFACC